MWSVNSNETIDCYISLTMYLKDTALIDFITKACHFYFDDYLENIEDQNPDI